jgi:NADH:ubiquinone oxidoreductase subunit E
MDIKKVDEIIKNRQGEKGALISILHDIQEAEGHLPEEFLNYLSEKIHTPLSEIFRVVTYFDKAFKLAPPIGEHTIKVCQGTNCHLKYSDQVVTEIEEELDKNGEEKNFNLETVKCLGCCDVAPAVEIDGQILDKDSAKSTIKKLKSDT